MFLRINCSSNLKYLVNINELTKSSEFNSYYKLRNMLETYHLFFIKLNIFLLKFAHLSIRLSYINNKINYLQQMNSKSEDKKGPFSIDMGFHAFI